MMKKLKWISLLTLSILLFACDEEEDDIQVCTPNTCPSKLSKIERTMSNSDDIELIVRYQYTDVGVQKIINEEFTSDSSFTNEIIFDYTDNKPTSANGFTIEYDTSQLTLTTDDTREIYFYSGNTLTKIELYDRVGTVFIPENYVYLTYNNQANVSRIDVHDGQDMLTYYYTYEYDTNPNLFTSINLPIRWFANSLYFDASLNNIIAYNEFDANGSLISSVSYEYNYNTINLPTERKETTTFGDATEIVYEYFTYTE